MLMDLLRAVFALAVTLGLFAFGVYAARRWGPKGLLQITAPGARRLSVVESLSLDPNRRLVLVRLDGQDRLFLLGVSALTAPEQRRPRRWARTAAQSATRLRREDRRGQGRTRVPWQ